MGSFGRKIGQNDTVLDFCDEVKKKGFISVFEEYGNNFSFKGLLGEDISSYDGYGLNCSLFIISLVVEGCKPNSITKEYYCNEGDSVDKIFQVASCFQVSKECVEQAKLALRGILKYLKQNKTEYKEISLKGTSLYDEMGIKNKVPFENSYDFYVSVVSELAEGLKGIKGCNNGVDTNDCTEHTVFMGYSRYNISKDSSNPLNVPSIDKNMLNSGLKDVLRLESEDYSRCYYLAEEVKSFPKEIYNFLISVFKAQEDSLFKGNETAKDIDISYILEGNTCFDYVAEFIIQECEENKDYIEFGFSMLELKKVSKEEFWGDDFGDSDINTKTVKSLTANIIRDWNERGITIDRIRFLSNIHFATDIEKLSSYHLYKGVSRVFKDIWWVSDSPQPITEDTYEVIYTIVAPESENPRKLGILRGDLAEKMDDCEFEQFDEGDEKIFVDEDDCLKSPTELVEKLLNTPISEELAGKYISDKQLYKWDNDRINGKSGVFK